MDAASLYVFRLGEKPRTFEVSEIEIRVWHIVVLSLFLLPLMLVELHLVRRFFPGAAAAVTFETPTSQKAA